ncbi:hypothetical protein K2Q16_00165 [Patescibacteria group bacterium]|nr:hypothetical protein [Patescibacteria group bacterium]
MSLTVLSFTLAGLIVAWVALSVLVGIEEKRGMRIFLSGARAQGDRSVSTCATLLAKFLRYVDHHIVRLTWYYSLHSFLQAALRVVVSLYDYLEQRFHLNRKRARALRAERRGKRHLSGATASATTSHLGAIAEYKESTALTDKEKQKLKTKKLERE